MMTEKIYNGVLNTESNRRMEEIIEVTMREEQVKIILESEECIRTERIDPLSPSTRGGVVLNNNNTRNDIHKREEKQRANTVAPMSISLFTPPKEERNIQRSKLNPPNIIFMKQPGDEVCKGDKGDSEVKVQNISDVGIQDLGGRGSQDSPREGNERAFSSSSSLADLQHSPLKEDTQNRITSPLISPRPPQQLMGYKEDMDIDMGESEVIVKEGSEEKKRVDLEESAEESQEESAEESAEESPEEEDDHFPPMEESGPMPLLKEDTTINFHSFKLIQKIGSGSFGKVFKVINHILCIIYYILYIYIYIGYEDRQFRDICNESAKQGIFSKTQTVEICGDRVQRT